MDSQFLGALLITLVIFIGIFLLFREFFCWYWKINERIALQRQILDELRQTNGKPVLAPVSDRDGLPFSSSVWIAYRDWCTSHSDASLVGFISVLEHETKRPSPALTRDKMNAAFPEATGVPDFQAVLTRIEAIHARHV